MDKPLKYPASSTPSGGSTAVHMQTDIKTDSSFVRND